MKDQGSVVDEPTQKKDDEGRAEELEALQKRLDRLMMDRDWAQEWTRSYFIATAVFLFLAVSIGGAVELWLKAVTTVGSEILTGVALGTAFLALCACAAGFGERNKLRGVSNDIEQAEFQVDLYSHKFEREIKAEKLLRLNDLQLRRYYDTNLNQNSKVFALGVGCIVAGVAIVGLALYALHHLQSANQTEKIATAVLGGVGAILTNYVAAIYFKMHASANENLASFHERLVETHQLMMGNLLAARIDDDTLRWDTLAKLALKLTPSKGNAQR